VLDAAVFLAVVPAIVFGGAAIGKFVAGGTTQDRLVALLEGAVVVGLLLPRVRLVGALAATFLSLAYVLYAFSPAALKRCHCFGARLPSTSLTAQRWRNATLAITTLSCVGAIVLAGPGTLATPLFDYLGGVVLGGFVITIPWALDWLESGEWSAAG
jgi:hypothetical protein